MMKTALFVVLGMVSFVSAQAEGWSQFAGEYIAKRSDGRYSVIARVSYVPGTHQMKAVMNPSGLSCTARLEKRTTRAGYPAMNGSCSTGNGFKAMIWEARFTLNARGAPILKFRGLEYGDEVLGFDQWTAATKR